MIVADFDGTLADTFQPSPNGIGVTEAYKSAILSIFGNKGNDLYQQIGGLQNRAPGELIVALLTVAQGYKKEILANAKAFHEKQNGNLSGLVPKGKGSGLIWTDSSPESTLSEMLVLKKLQLLASEVSSQWPKPFPGVVSFLKQCEQCNIKFAILSSGHQLFIEKVFRVWGIQHPIMVTDDDLRGKTPYLSKPDAALMSLILKKVPEDTPVIYLGDDPVKDGGLAVNAGIPFGWFNPSQKKFSGALPKDTLQFQNWDDLREHLYFP